LQGLIRALQLVGVNAVPAWGFFDDHWSASSTLIVYWFENIIATLLIAVRIVIHRRVTKKRGYFASKKSYNSFLSSFLASSLLFTAVHGVFIAVIVLIIAKTGPANRLDVEHGIAAVTAFLAFGLLVDLARIRNTSFAYIRQLTEHALGRVFVIHITILVGMMIAMFTGKTTAIFIVFVTLKTLLDIAGQTPQYDPTEAPRWLNAIMPKQNGKTFADFWRKDHAARIESAAEAELPITSPDAVQGAALSRTKGRQRAGPYTM
jgi:hypothetical protein